MSTFFIHINNHALAKQLGPGYSFTVAGIIEGEVMKFGISQCSPKDQFCKKLGRTRSEGRARSKKESVILYIPKRVLDSGEFGKYFVEEAKKLVNQ